MSSQAGLSCRETQHLHGLLQAFKTVGTAGTNACFHVQAYSLYHGRPVSDADFQPRRTRYENTGQLQLLHRSYNAGTPTTVEPSVGNARLSQTNTQDVDIQDLTSQLKVPLYKQLIGNTAMVDLSSLSANPQVFKLMLKFIRQCATLFAASAVPSSANRANEVILCSRCYFRSRSWASVSLQIHLDPLRIALPTTF